VAAPLGFAKTPQNQEASRGYCDGPTFMNTTDNKKNSPRADFSGFFS
jgi:hypothetical protein